VKGAAWHPRRGRFNLERALDPARLPWLRVDWHILLIALSLLAIGLMFVKGMADADERFDRSDIVFQSHLTKVLIALPALFAALCVRARWLRNNAWLAFGVCIVLLLLVPVLGQERNNARRWIPLPGGFDLQPSELAKLGFAIAMARLLYTRRMKDAQDWLRAGALLAVPMGLVMVQPDLGTALTLVPVAAGMIYLAGASGRSIVKLALAAAAVSWLAVQLDLVRPYQLQRIQTWRESWAATDLILARNGPAFHAYHNRVSIGNGGLLGQGLGQGVANQAAHLPERDCDSIFSVVAEEAGFLGASGILALYTLLIVLLLHSASGVRERFSRLVVGGIALIFASHLVVNVGVNLGLMPLTGLPLPLFSTGGSSLLASFAALGLALGLAAQSEPTFDEDAFRD
jgi:rod shape determining protein RodA